MTTNQRAAQICPHREGYASLHASLAVNGTENASDLNVYRFRTASAFHNAVILLT
jgi:hypothetical protein